MSKSKEEIMGEYNRLTHAVFAEVDHKESPGSVLLDPSHPLATTDLASQAREVWAAAAEVCDNPVMAAHIRGVESEVRKINV